jgi:tetratricopeptide (TPR) repeat protein
MTGIAQALADADYHRQAGDVVAALRIYRQLLRANPDDLVLLWRVGAAYLALGRRADAEECYRRAVRLQPENPEAHYQLGVLSQKVGDLDLAIASYGKAIRLRPDVAEAHNNLGVAFQALDRPGDAEACYRKALSLKPDYPDAHNNLGVVLKQRGDLAGAVACYEQALRLRPDYVQALNNLANGLQAQGRLAESAERYRETLAVRPDYVEAHYNLGIALAALEKRSEAESAFRQALELRPSFPEAHNNLGIVFLQDGRLDEAVDSFEAALGLRPDFAEAHYNLANAFRDQGDVDRAIQSYRRALAHRPDYIEAHANLANVLQEAGDFDAARAECEDALRLKPDCAQTLFMLAELATQGRGSFGAERASRLHSLLSRADLSLEDAGLLHFALANLANHARDWDLAFEHFQTGNAARREALRSAGAAFDIDRHREFVDRLIATFEPDFFEQVHPLDDSSERPVFIIGMPRSGTTLVEQILAQHPLVHAAGERKDIARIADALAEGDRTYPECVALLDRETVRRAAKRYTESWQALEQAIECVTDKMPLNFLHLGLIAALFPRARVVHCRRDPRDICVSCYCQYFRELDFTWDLADLGNYYREYERLMAYWREVLPLRMMDVVYEDLVADQEGVSRRLVEFCGLAWDDRCLAFHESRRPVQTVSKLQVRRPLYASAVGRWRRYERHLGPLLQALDPDQSAREDS